MTRANSGNQDTPKPWSVRRLTEADAQAVVDLRRRMLVESPWAFSSSPEDDRQKDAATVAESLRGEGFAMIGGFVHGADGAARLGASAVVHRERQLKRRHVAWLMAVYTEPESRGMGLGRAVVELAIETARAWPGVASVYLGVSERAEAARRLYERLGFVPWGMEMDAVRVEGVSYAETLMRLTLVAGPPAIA